LLLVVAVAYAAFSQASGPINVHVGEHVRYRAAGFAAFERVDVTVQLRGGGNNDAVAIMGRHRANRSGAIATEFRFPKAFYHCSGAQYCTAHAWPRRAHAQVQICGTSISLCAVKNIVVH
jgi:hypothetical protein